MTSSAAARRFVERMNKQSNPNYVQPAALVRDRIKSARYFLDRDDFATARDCQRQALEVMGKVTRTDTRVRLVDLLDELSLDISMKQYKPWENCKECGTHSDDCGELTDGYCWSCNRQRVTDEVYHGSQLIAFSRGGERFVSDWVNFPEKMHTPIDNAIQEQRLACRPELMSTDFVPYDGRQFLRYVPRA